MSNRKIDRKAKVKALAANAGTPGEQQAAQAALERLGTAVAPKPVTGQRLTDAGIRKLPAPATGYRIYWDADLAGFGCRVTAGGAKSFIFNYRVKATGQERRQTIGGFPNWQVSAARAKAKQLRGLVDNGQDPRGEFEEQREAPTMFDLIDRFEREVLPKRRPNTIRDYRAMIDRHIRPHFGKFTKVADVNFADIDRLHAKLSATAPYQANRTIAVCSKLFNLAIKWQMRTDNPCRGIEKNPENKRKRYLSGDELKRLTAALAKYPDKQFVNIITLLLLTGARKSEVLSMRVADLDLQKGIWTKPASTTKQKSEHITPLSKAALQVLKTIRPRGEYVFPSDSKSGHVVEIKRAWHELCENAGITGLRIHDLRHSFASQLVSSGASLPLIGALLGHASTATTHRYAHLFQDVEREAVEKIGAIVSKANGGG